MLCCSYVVLVVLVVVVVVVVVVVQSLQNLLFVCLTLALQYEISTQRKSSS